MRLIEARLRGELPPPTLKVPASTVLAAEAPSVSSHQVPAPTVKINIEALAASLAAMMKLAKPGETQETTARKAAQFYQYMLDQGLITPDGLGEGNLKKTG